MARSTVGCGLSVSVAVAVSPVGPSGGDTVTEAIAVPEEIRAKIPGDFGRSKAIAWYYLGGFGIVHDDAANARILMWDSAA
jgi:hypothetical protein